MKKLFVLLLIIFTTVCYSQTTTKKYNDLRHRWEYYNSSGQMIGYEKYNSLMQQWEYTDLSQNVSSRVHDYGEPQSFFDADLAIMALATKQARYDKRENKISELIDELGNNLKSIKSYSERRDALNYFSDKLVNYIGIWKGEDIINNDKNYYVFYNGIIDCYNSTLEYIDKNRSSNTIQNNQPKYTPIKGFVNIVSYAPLLKEPDMNAEEILTIETDKVYVIERTNEHFCKVKTSGKIGYLWINWIKE